MGTTIDDEAEFASQQMLRNSCQVVIIELSTDPNLDST